MMPAGSHKDNYITHKPPFKLVRPELGLLVEPGGLPSSKHGPLPTMLMDQLGHQSRSITGSAAPTGREMLKLSESKSALSRHLRCPARGDASATQPQPRVASQS